eukprot:CAMPEP_0197842092 /NCGR_PEP_ID=MMETSP1437-20131217/46544_1 /TAXON_ID=49252 ORGANISM="Eucampia antarctica, Strain CCMP1452" /NCGR_SAMPLE_ID=MMETSP1437 /ASSEMBLY_ACC=CAM_ASM_001096 /LENGTH=888 /DNA_ID=CAMNT_0043451931 /DNA_START=83 /DNA_END=2749 /DNA_ORIENTATION=-
MNNDNLQTNDQFNAVENNLSGIEAALTENHTNDTTYNETASAPDSLFPRQEEVEAGFSMFSHSADTAIMANQNYSSPEKELISNDDIGGRRSVFSGEVKQRYGCRTPVEIHMSPSQDQTPKSETDLIFFNQEEPTTAPETDSSSYNSMKQAVLSGYEIQPTETTSACQNFTNETTGKTQNYTFVLTKSLLENNTDEPSMRPVTPPPPNDVNKNSKNCFEPPLLDIATSSGPNCSNMSPMTPQIDDRKRVKSVYQTKSQMTENSRLLQTVKSADFSNSNEDTEEVLDNRYGENYDSLPYVPKSDQEEEHYTVHAQTFILSLAFFFVWSPQNLMAPNLTQMGQYFHFNSSQRDLYLGANIAFATGVLSLPVSAFIGFLADMVSSRKILFAGTALIGGVSSICTGLSKTYTQLYLARFVCGGCMAGCVPIAFSLLGDLFDAKDRNAASSGLTAMMGGGILFGQVYAGAVGETLGWKHSFYVSGCCSIFSSFLVMKYVKEPVRGGKEKVLQDMIAKGTKYDRKLTLKGFFDAMTKNQSNVILMLQGFFANVPWGMLFTFLNDYLSQEQGLSVRKATYLVFLFGIGCAAGGILGGYLGTKAMDIDRRLLPLFMAVSTFLGIFPFLGLLDAHYDGTGFFVSFCAISAGCIANLPSVNVRPCLINVNPPETRGAALTAANLLVNLARGAGPSAITMTGAIWGVSRQFSFNVMLIVFWGITSVFLLILMITLPRDQDAMDAELKQYAQKMIYDAEKRNIDGNIKCDIQDETENATIAEESIVSIEERMTSFDGVAARQSIGFLGDAFREIGEELSHFGHGGSNRKINHVHNYAPDHRRSTSSKSEQRKQWQSSEHQTNGTTNSHQINYDDFERGPIIDYSRGTQHNAQSGETPTLL